VEAGLKGHKVDTEKREEKKREAAGERGVGGELINNLSWFSGKGGCPLRGLCRRKRKNDWMVEKKRGILGESLVLQSREGFVDEEGKEKRGWGKKRNSYDGGGGGGACAIKFQKEERLRTCSNEAG